jgi:Transmembrane secretion effector
MFWAVDSRRGQYPHRCAAQRICTDVRFALGNGKVAIIIHRRFYDAMRPIERLRLRNGAFGWAITRDIADNALWTERYQFPTWGDYLRMRDRCTQTDMDAQETADEFMQRGVTKIVRRRLERPFGSVRWRADSLDTHQQTIGYIGPWLLITPIRKEFDLNDS